jgi:hypothetical protein
MMANKNMMWWILGIVIVGLLVLTIAFVTTWQFSRPPASPDELKIAGQTPAVDLAVCEGDAGKFSDLAEALRQKELVCQLFISAPEQISEEIGQLYVLHTLVVSQSDLTQLPSQIGSLPNLLFLDVSNNAQLQSLPDEIVTLNKLKVLNVWGTAIKTLPADIGRMNKLRQIVVDQGQLRAEEAFRIKRELPSVQLIELDPGQGGSVFFAG